MGGATLFFCAAVSPSSPGTRSSTDIFISSAPMLACEISPRSRRDRAISCDLRRGDHIVMCVCVWGVGGDRPRLYHDEPVRLSAQAVERSRLDAVQRRHARLLE